MNTKADLSPKQLRILKVLDSAEAWTTRENMEDQVGRKGFSLALGAPTRDIREGSLEHLGYVERRDETTPFEYRITDLGQRALAEFESVHGEIPLLPESETHDVEMNTPTPIIVPPNKTGSIRRRHPWVLDKSVITPTITPADGDPVDLVTDDGHFLARGIFNSSSRIRVRLYTWNEEQEFDQAFWRSRLEAAFELRRNLDLLDPQTACRLVFSEADGLSGLIVDRYADCLVIQITALAMRRQLDLIIEFFQEKLSPRAIVLRVDEHIAKAEGIEAGEELLAGEIPAEPVVIREHGIEYEVDLQTGQKTGAYLDQQENHAAAARYLNGGRVLDVCTYHGGFALAAAKLGNAAEVIGIDSSAKAVEVATHHAERNGLTSARFEVGQCFDKLQEYRDAGEQFDMVVLDPPRFAGSRREIDKALRAYHRLNRLAVELLPPGGILVTCSCSGHVIREDFQFMLAGVAQKSGREIQVLESRGAAGDHPVSLTCPESEYLKCFICRVLR